MGDRPRATSQGTPGPAGRRWAPSPTAAWTRTAEGLAVVMDVEHGVPLLLSASGTAIWDAVVDGRGPFEDLHSCPPRPEMDIITAVAQSASGDVAEVAEDVITFLEDLVAHHVVNRR